MFSYLLYSHDIYNASFCLSTEIMPKRKSEKFFCEFCSAVFDTEWIKIAHSTTQHSDLNAAFTSIQSDMQNGGSLVDLTQFFDPISMDIIFPK